MINIIIYCKRHESRQQKEFDRHGTFCLIIMMRFLLKIKINFIDCSCFNNLTKPRISLTVVPFTSHAVMFLVVMGWNSILTLRYKVENDTSVTVTVSMGSKLNQLKIINCNIIIHIPSD